MTTESTPTVLNLPIGLSATGLREEFDSIGKVQVPADHYWGAQTQRSLIHFNIGHDKMPKEVYHAYGYVKKAAAVVNTKAGLLIYAVTGAHLAMIVAGLVYAVVMTVRTLGGEYHGRDREGLVAAALFWYATIAVYAVIWFAIYVTK